jgi:Flp pilus assembly protein TadG
MGSRRGTSTVEMAIIAPLLFFMLFGIVEAGLLVKNLLGINQAAREGVRAAVIGAPSATIEARVKANAATLDMTGLSWGNGIQGYSRTCLPDGTWSAWVALADVVGETSAYNNAETGSQVAVDIAYPHRLILGHLFSRLTRPGTQGIVILQTSQVMRRE